MRATDNFLNLSHQPTASERCHTLTAYEDVNFLPVVTDLGFDREDIMLADPELFCSDQFSLANGYSTTVKTHGMVSQIRTSPSDRYTRTNICQCGRTVHFSRSLYRLS